MHCKSLFDPRVLDRLDPQPISSHQWRMRFNTTENAGALANRQGLALFDRVATGDEALDENDSYSVMSE